MRSAENIVEDTVHYNRDMAFEDKTKLKCIMECQSHSAGKNFPMFCVCGEDSPGQLHWRHPDSITCSLLPVVQHVYSSSGD